MPAALIPPQNHSTGLNDPFQLNSKPNLSPKCTLQSSESKKASREIMLLGPTLDTFRARVECRANKLTQIRGRSTQFKASHLLCSMVPWGDFCSAAAPTEQAPSEGNQSNDYTCLQMFKKSEFARSWKLNLTVVLSVKVLSSSSCFEGCLRILNRKRGK